MTVCALNALASLLVASEFFKRVMPTVLRWIGDLDESSGSEIQLNLWGMELGYWAGGLLMLTFLHKLLDRNWTGLIQFMPLFQISIRSTNEDKLAGLKVGVWYFLCLYSCYAGYRFLRESFILIHRMLSMFVGDEVLDFVSASCLESANPDEFSAGPFPDNDEDLCVCCMDLPVAYEMSSCGHLATCTSCRPRLVYHRLRNRSGATTVPPMRMLNKEQLECTLIQCPMCRTQGKLIRRGSTQRDGIAANLHCALPPRL